MSLENQTQSKSVTGVINLNPECLEIFGQIRQQVIREHQCELDAYRQERQELAQHHADPNRLIIY